MADHHQRNYDEYRRGGRRDWSERAGDEVRSWFGDDEARMRRAHDERDERYRDDRHEYGGEPRRQDGRAEGARSPGEWGRYDEPRGSSWSSGRERESWAGAGGRGYYGQSWRGGEAGRPWGEDPGRSRWQATYDEPRWGQDSASWRQAEGSGGRYAGGREGGAFSGGYGGFGGYGGSGGGYGSGGYGGRSQSGAWSGEGGAWSGEYGSEGSRYRDDEYGGAGARRSGGGERPLARTSYSGRGPKDYQRSDDRIREEISDRMTDDDRLDATEITIVVARGEVTLSGTVADREQKRRAEDLAESISGVREVTNNIRVARDEHGERGQSTSATQAGQLGQPSGTTGSRPAGTGTPS